MNTFSTLFGSDLDYRAFSNDANYCPSPVDTAENLTELAKLERSFDVSGVHVSLGGDISGKTADQREVESESLRQKGNALFSAGKHKEALKVYEEGILTNPRDVRFFTNAAVCLIALGRNEEALTKCSIASDVESAPKAYMLHAKALCNLGFTKQAKEALNDVMENAPMTDWNQYIQDTEKLIKAVPKERRRKTDAKYRDNVKKRLLSGDERSPDVYTFLLQQLVDTSGGMDGMIDDSIPFMIKCFTKAPWIRDLVKNPNLILELACDSYRLVGTFLASIQIIADEKFQLCQQLVQESFFIPFMSGLAKAIVRKEFIHTAFVRCGPGYIFGSFFGSFIGFLATLSKYPSIRNDVIKTTPPFNDVAFYAMLMAIYPCIYDPAESPDTNMLIGSFTSILAEPWCLDKFEADLSRADYILSLLATLSTLYLQARWGAYRLESPPYVSFFPFWMKASQRPRIAEIMVRRPGIWSHLSIRLQYSMRNNSHKVLKSFVVHQHHRDHLQETLRVIKRVAQFLPTAATGTSVITKGSRNRLIESFVELLNCDYSQTVAFVEQNAKVVLQILAKLAHWAPQYFAKDFLSAQDAKQRTLLRVASIAFTSISAETSSAAVECFSILVKHATSNQLAQLTGDKKLFSAFVAKLVSLLGQPSDGSANKKKPAEEGQKQLSEKVIECLSSLLGDVTSKENASAKDNALLQTLLTLKPASIIESIARQVQKGATDAEKLSESPVRLSLTLIADLVALDRTFEESAKNLNDKLACSTLVELQRILDTRPDEENVNLQSLASFIDSHQFSTPIKISFKSCF